MSGFLFLLVLELVVAALCVELMTKGLPQQLRKAADLNQLRMDGSVSKRRVHNERHATGKLRRDLWATWLSAAFIANVGLFMVHLFVVPLDLAASAAGVVSLDPGKTKARLKAGGFDRKLEISLQDNHGMSPRDSAKAARSLWEAAPLVAVVLVFPVIAAFAVVRTGYMRALADYSTGLKERSQENLYLDLGRSQDSFAGNGREYARSHF